MKIGVIGLGKMGGNMSRRLMKAGHDCVVYARTAKTREALVKDGALEAVSVADLRETCSRTASRDMAYVACGPDDRRRGCRTRHIARAPGDIVIDGGNSFYKDDIRRAKMLAEKGIRYVDCGTSGGVWGIERGYCMMIGGPKEAVDYLDPIFAALAPGLGTLRARLAATKRCLAGRTRLYPRRSHRRRALCQDGA